MLTKSLVAAAAAGGVLLSATPALAADGGLYGKGDPTYDGVYRQSLSILALQDTGRTVPKAALNWLQDQQCSDGGFTAYRATTKGACPAPDPVNYAGQDSNSTAMAVAVLWHSGAKQQARKAAKWLRKHIAADGGWAYYPAPGATSDANSTALASAAIDLTGKPLKKPEAYLESLQKRCDAASAIRGGILFDSTGAEPNNNATAQVGWMLGGGLTLPRPVKIAASVPALKCKGAKKDKASLVDASAGYLAQQLVDSKGALPYGGGYPGVDYAGTASATLALANAGAGRKAVRQAVSTLKKNAKTWIAASGDDSPGSIALLILVAKATGENPRDFGGLNLYSLLNKTRQ